MTTIFEDGTCCEECSTLDQPTLTGFCAAVLGERNTTSTCNPTCNPFLEPLHQNRTNGTTATLPTPAADANELSEERARLYEAKFSYALDEYLPPTLEREQCLTLFRGFVCDSLFPVCEGETDMRIITPSWTELCLVCLVTTNNETTCDRLSTCDGSTADAFVIDLPCTSNATSFPLETPPPSATSTPPPRQPIPSDSFVPTPLIGSFPTTPTSVNQTDSGGGLPRNFFPPVIIVALVAFACCVVFVWHMLARRVGKDKIGARRERTTPLARAPQPPQSPRQGNLRASRVGEPGLYVPPDYVDDPSVDGEPLLGV